MSYSILNKIKLVWSEPEYRTYFEDDKEPRNCYKVKVRYDGKQITLPFGDSIHNTHNGTRTSDKSFLETMVLDSTYTKEYYPTFEDFAKEFGYETDSRQAEKIYKKCLKHAEKINSVFTTEELESLRSVLEKEDGY